MVTALDGELIEKGWRAALGTVLQDARYGEILQFVEAAERAGDVVYPPKELRFAAFEATPFAHVKVVILGQDPYHGPGQAHGLSFSVPQEVKLPPSLRNIYKELQGDLGADAPASGDLSGWARQGVLLLNSSLSVAAGKAGSHAKCGWQWFTDAAISALNAQREGLVFVLWGAHAQKKAALIDEARHHIVAGPHPSPLSAHRGFFGSKPFSQVNDYLQGGGNEPIDWLAF
ncbi:uracil-DNA glycosylase [Polycladidibacter hongkongensis]|uniref:uracil-DNA glycosylase n=1 Tax=Polycladidibacter hongkongensis TaxID=1647556 RepID=UPI00083465F2|nr:uracil-DNA glycosylase [Pseudovibrio hongkongensis]